MMSFIVPALILAAIAAGLLFALAGMLPATHRDEPAPPPSSDVYQSAQLYWREIGQARDWEGLKAQLRRWRQLANPGWDEADIDQVARALNAAVFRFAVPGPAH